MKRLQPFDFKSSQYERPNQDWVCGRKDCGDACALGPDARGGCRTTSECRPRKDGARWFCTRPDSRGGKCPDGPLPELPEEIHGAVYCPGSITLRSFRSLQPADFRQDLELNLVGAVRFLQACQPRLK
ncbi:MAG: hypothetical protein WCP82_12200, partial [Alphaproteobacteria bacterium]